MKTIVLLFCLMAICTLSLGQQVTQMEAAAVARSGDTVILAQPSSLHLYPNPTDNTLTVKSTEKVEDIRILDNMGRPMFRWFIESNADGLLTLNVQNLPDGVYILQLTTSDRKSHLGRFVKK